MQRLRAIETPTNNYTVDRQLPTLDEARTSSKIDYLLRIGLIRDQSKLNLYRRVLANPQSAVNNQITRNQTAEILDVVLDMIFNDTVLWNRFKTLLLRNHDRKLSSLREELSEDGMRSLIKKSNDHEVPLDTIFEIYSRGAQDGGEVSGFNRVNSFLAGGKARKMDADLLGETVVQPEPKHDDTLSIVKRILKDRRH